MSILTKVKSSLSLKTSLALALPMLVLLGGAATYITINQTEMMTDLTFEKAKVAAKLGAQVYGHTLEEAIDVSVLSVQDVFDEDYQEIQGYEWGEHPKYHTRFDSFTDHAVLRLQDEFLESADFIFAVGQDRNGYIPTHNSKYQKPVTGDPAVDLEGNRSKRIFDDEVGLKAAKNEEEALVQLYARDTGAKMWDVSSPIYVKGKHWGTFRLAVSMERIDARARGLLLLLSGVFSVLAAAVIGAIMVTMNWAIGPVVRLTDAANKISLGEGLDIPVKPESEDEVGRLARSLDRLRISMRAAMGRLGE